MAPARGRVVAPSWRQIGRAGGRGHVAPRFPVSLCFEWGARAADLAREIAVRLFENGSQNIFISCA
jgi:hypothetical protein